MHENEERSNQGSRLSWSVHSRLPSASTSSSFGEQPSRPVHQPLAAPAFYATPAFWRSCRRLPETARLCKLDLDSEPVRPSGRGAREGNGAGERSRVLPTALAAAPDTD